ncbi:uncharacterized protein LOC118188793 [Stegodyphus dumicola]|uniref:uncharacterized protein LOC118188793 n=1 Tax=Stegodyphus dumicola TaxID=202533 RepID=UPI0015AF25CB|nr:uncharacterized protein LOC118188793 [Stegodyphus dumicola]
MLGNLLEFLRLEVKSEERLQLARLGFVNDQFEKLKTKENIPTAACIVSNEKEYDDVFNEWVRDGIIEIVDKDEKKRHYLPHHPLIKIGVTTTKIRPVFDASTKDSKGNSLNNCLEKGPNLLELVPKLIMQFRENAIGVKSYIKKAFLQISLNPEDREYFKFLWWKDLSRREEIITLLHCRVVFGASPSPFLLEATIAYHLENVPDERKHTACQLKESFYVDNCITSLETKEEQKNLFLKLRS